MKRTNCLICNSNKLFEVIDLGVHPFADTFIGIDQYGDSEPIYPLTCDLCEECGHLQTGYETDPVDRYTKYDYSYTSSNSSHARDHWDKFFNEVEQITKIDDNSLVVEIGSNDGYLGSLYSKNGVKFIGIDASPFMAELAEKNGIQTIVGLLDTHVVNNVCNKYGKSNLVIANNVLNHADSLRDFVSNVSDMLLDDGFFVFEVPYWLKDFQNNHFDKIYHEHVNYFSVYTLKKLLEECKFTIFDIKDTAYHGGSIRVIAIKANSNILENQSDIIINKYIEQEKSAGIFTKKSYLSFVTNIYYRRNEVLKKIYSLKADNASIIAIGAAARGNTLLNFYNLDSTVLDYVTDLSPYKLGKFTPLTRIEIIGDKVFKNYKKVYAVFLTNNIPDNIRNILLEINGEIVFIDL